MEKEMEEKIKKQLVYNKINLHCVHNPEKACDECMKELTGNVSGLTGNVSGIEGKTTEIIELLNAHKKT